MAKYEHKCMLCGTSFSNSFETSKFCSRECYCNFYKENGKLKIKKCSICGQDFRPSYSGQVFCSVDCRAKSTEKKIKCICEFCGKQFERIQSEVYKNTHHYCSQQCHYEAISWDDSDVLILQNNFEHKSYKEIYLLLNGRKSIDDIKRKAYSLGMTRSNFWSDEETKILIDNYSSSPYQTVMSLLPNRTRSSINGKAKSLDLKSYYYLNRRYTAEDEEYLKNNYLQKSNEDLASILHRSVGGIAQHLCILKLYRPNDRNGYNDLAEYIRGRLIPWIKRIKRVNNFTCSITGGRSNIIVHHIRGFNLILNEAIDKMNFPIYDNVSDYSDEQLDGLFNTFYTLQESYGSYICLTENVHKHFHSIYGYGDNTEEQWNEFVNTYYKN